jgi:hypothetical protein
VKKIQNIKKMKLNKIIKKKCDAQNKFNIMLSSKIFIHSGGDVIIRLGG